MKEYPPIPGSSRAPHEPCIAFDKLDGSNLRFEWHRKRGWNKFGTRTRLFDATDPIFGSAISIFLTKYASAIEQMLRHNKLLRNVTELICFAEFLGPNSFAGQHVATDSKDVVLFDINLHKKGFISPRDFVNEFGHLHIPRVVYEGNLNKSFIEDVRSNKFDLSEGVICKGESGHKLWMCKIKTLQYLEKIKARLENWEDYWE